jgi:hypothetical protein
LILAALAHVQYPYAGISIWSNWDEENHDSAIIRSHRVWLLSAFVTRDSNISQRAAIAFTTGGLQNLIVPVSVETIGEFCFGECVFFRSVGFESASKLQRIERSAFADSGLRRVTIPASVRVICEAACCQCLQFGYVAFESRSRLQRIEAKTFTRTPLSKTVFPGSLEVICGSCFANFWSLRSLEFEPGSQLRKDETNEGTVLISKVIANNAVFISKQ